MPKGKVNDLRLAIWAIYILWAKSDLIGGKDKQVEVKLNNVPKAGKIRSGMDEGKAETFRKDLNDRLEKCEMPKPADLGKLLSSSAFRRR